MPAKADLQFRDREDYRILGTSKSQVDSLQIVMGQGDFGIDTRVPNMLYGSYVKCPAVGGKLVNANIADLKALPGIVDAYKVEGNGDVRELLDGVGIVGTSTWAVFEARKMLNATWDERNANKDSWSAFTAFANQQGNVGAEVLHEQGDVDSALEDPDNTVISSFYEYPYLTHLCLEPMNCTAHYRPGKNGGKDHLEVWLPTQSGPRFQTLAKQRYGLEKISLRFMLSGWVAALAAARLASTFARPLSCRNSAVSRSNSPGLAKTACAMTISAKVDSAVCEVR
ncbi:MAG: hypothetical protein CM15mP120_18700 [Pseudomonadota bacterium]|nr:MAG: hypothetical protein CM15mP120_18700 [Pseudomonadota bacterium]